MNLVVLAAAASIAAIAGGCASERANGAAGMTTEAATPVQAVSPVGDWHGVITRPPVGEIRLGLRIDEAAAGQFTGALSNADQGSMSTPLSGIVFADGALSFSVPASRASFSGSWDAAAGAWVGEYGHPAGNSPVRFARGVVPPLPPLPAVAGLDGRWEGRIQSVLPLALRVQTSDAGTTGYLDMTGQVTGIPLTSLELDGRRASFAIASMRMTFAGELSDDGASITGALSQPGQATPLVLTRTSLDAEAAAVLHRPQTPQAPYPYLVEDVVIDNPDAADVRLACTLTRPNTSGRHAAAVLISGSGPQDRDATVLGHKTFLVLADHLTRNGIAVLRCDDRGVGRSSGDFATATLEDMVSDAEAAFMFLRTHDDVDRTRTGLIGHSLGTMIGAMVAARHADTGFLVMLAAAGASGPEISLDQQQAIARADGMSEGFLASSGALWRKVVAVVSSDMPRADVREAVFALLGDEGPAAYPNGMPEAIARAEAERLSSDYVQQVYAYDPSRTLSGVEAPILAMNGALDVQATPKLNLAGLRRILAAHPDATILEAPGLNHAFQHARTGAMSEYADIEETFAPEALDAIADWLVERVGK